MIELIEVEKRYLTSNGYLYVNSLQIPKGEIVGILGDNGSGKTTLLKTIMGLGERNGGEVKIGGLPPQRQYDRMAFITEEGSFLPHMTPVQYGEFLTCFFPRFDQGHYHKLLEFYTLETDEKIKTFSKGQKLKLEICAGLAKKADYILMDEPFVGKDLFMRKDFLKLLVTGLQGNETVLITTHLIDEIENVIDRAVILHKGRVKADIYMDQLRDQGKTLPELMAEIAKYKGSKYSEVYD